jgi:predicted short-subunit dehydrogenase-like oxidoreductase (DUF2520 family)
MSAPSARPRAAVRLSRTIPIGIVGTGRVGAVLGAALTDAGHRVIAAAGLSSASLARIDQLLPGTPVKPVDEVPDGVELLLLAVPDDALGPLVRGLVEGGSIRPGQVVAHTSGAHGVDVLAPIVAIGGHGLALHPAMTFTGTARDLERLAGGVSFGVTAPAPLRALATRLVADLGGSVEWVAEAARPLYHAALAHGANHLVTLVNEAMDRLRDAGVVRPERVLAPLLTAALENTLGQGDGALTGPVVRGDAGTVAKHLVALRAVAPDSVPAYLALARRSADRAIAAGRLRAHDAEALLGVLAPSTKVSSATASSATASSATVDVRA